MPAETALSNGEVVENGTHVAEDVLDGQVGELRKWHFLPASIEATSRRAPSPKGCCRISITACIARS